MTEMTARRKLPVFATLIEAYRFLFANLGTLARLVWFPAIVGLVVTICARHYLPSIRAADEEGFDLSASFLEVAIIPIAIPAATAWYRLVILGLDDSNARIRYSIRVEEWRYFIRGSFLFLIVILVILGLFASTWQFPPLGEALEKLGIEEVFFISLASCSLLAVVRFVLVLPAVAVGNTMMFRDSFHATKGNTFRLYFAILLAILPSVIMCYPLDYVFFGKIIEYDMIYPIEYLVLESIFYWFFFTIDVSVIALAYKISVPANATT